MKIKRLKSGIKFIIDSLEVTVTINNIHIQDSFKVRYRKDMRVVLNDIKLWLDNNDITMDTPFNHRSIESMVNEWLAHNNLYRLDYKVEQTGSVDINYPQKWYVRLAYWFLSRIVL